MATISSPLSQSGLSSSSQVLPSTIEIRQDHIDEMYDRFDSGICDATRSNAVALTLSERMGRPVEVKTRESQRLLKIGKDTYPLSEALNHWLSRAERGLEVKAGVYRLQRRSMRNLRESKELLPVAA